ncbi:metal ABC transporter permease [Pararhizobium mangrovi]|uniref:Metal ABC transporter permease n=1 Tax=Pararhizobium mangrovi TaxID=2590452 RepID=A0A506TWM6_9HYPH|nr:metal ABC transporter permease [Pararhizobium mangrovi]TPW25900.1 metal ABC transporter permease [Pararhizobium mangrovi]
MNWPDFLALGFMRNAFATGTAVAIAGSLVGYFVVLRRQTFTAHALGNIGFAGAAGAQLVGFSPLGGLVVTTLAAAVWLTFVGARLSERDLGVGMLLMLALGLGVLFLNIYSANANAALGILFGSVLGIGERQMWVAIGVSVLVVVLLAILFRPLRIVTINEDFARAHGVPVELVTLAFMLTLALSIAVAVPVIGALLTFAIFVGPPAAAQAWTRRVGTGLALSVVLAVVQVWLGLLASYYVDYPATTWIAGLSFAVYLASRIGRPMGAAA